MSVAASNPGPLLGRDAEIELLTSLLDGIQGGGAGLAACDGGAGLAPSGALVLYGEPGIGKSRLLAVAAALARERGFTVLSATGVQSEAHLPFAGLHQLVRPLRFRAADLPAAQRAALDAAFGLGQGPAPERFQIAMAVLDLLGEVAADAPLLVLAEDAQWLDRPTTEVLAFVARRLQSDPIVLLAAVREGYPSPLVDAGLPQHRLGGLGTAEAMTLLDASAQQLSPVIRDRLLSEAAGNPLALTELPVGAAREEPATPGSLPLTQRLEQAFAARVSDLPEATRLLLLVAAHSDDERLGDIVDAAGVVAGSTLGLDLLEPAAEAGIVDLDLQSVRFRHPLIRSAVRQSASVLQRRRVHEALAEVLRAEPDRRVWHRAALISGTHEEIANELEEAAGRARRRGALAVALTAWQRAAELSPPAQRVRRLLAAAELAFELGQRDLVMPLLREVEHLDPDPLQRARATWIEELVQTRPLGDASRAAALIATAEQAGQAGDRDLQLDLTWLVASRAWLVDPAPMARRVLIEAADRLGDPESADLRILAIQAYADPFGKAPAILRRLRAAAADVHRDTDAARFLGPAAVAVGAFDIAATFLGEAVEGLRTQGRLGHLPRMLTLQGNMAAHVADWGVAIPAAEEARRLATELGEPQWVAAADTVDSIIAGIRGDQDEAERAAARAERIAVPAGANLTIAFAQFGRIFAALGAGQALRRLRGRRTPPGSGEPGPPPDHRVLAHRRTGRGSAAHRPDRRSASARDAGRSSIRRHPGNLYRHRAAARAGAAGTGPRGSRGAFRRGARRRPHGLAAAAGPAIAGLRPVAATPAPDRRVARAAAGRPRRLRRHGLRRLGRPGPPGAPGIRGVQPAARPRPPRPADRPGASDRPARRPGALEPGHRAAAVPVSPDDRHPPVPHLPQARDHQPR